MNRVVLDASALLAILNQEAGAETLTPELLSAAATRTLNLAEVHGKLVSSGAAYDNRFISVVTIENSKIVHWRDYMDSLASWMALNEAV